MKLNIINLILMCLTETECHLLAIWKIAGAVGNLASFFAKFGLRGRVVRFANGLDKFAKITTPTFFCDLVISLINANGITNVCFDK
jgi:hypothetical protein